ncbi:hypothetical protein AVEN_209293-1 [Araneus ventricosus]|uniref:Reverse transcriptase domain-containing protein n=1 Tax=Araneus ventricosus TaxID=182803 RepID=A0A4Y2CCN6_ARAVE|nr:hypothetical protein AVEN_209293-1 [Araneus ventricosus]
MSIILAGLSDLQIACYIDDVIIASHNFQDHLQRLELVFQRLTEANLKVKPSKCSFLQFEISFLGHTVREGQVLPDAKNLDSIKNTMPPQTKKQTVHVNRLVKVVERDTFPFIQDSSKNHCSSSQSLQRQPDEDEISKLYPPYTLPYKDPGEDVFISLNQQISSSSNDSTPAVTNNSKTGVLPRSCPYDLRPRNAN